MGICLDTIEDNDERIGQFIDTTINQNLAYKKAIKNYSCEYCSFKTSDINELNNHIIDKHSKDVCYFLVNNSIGRGNETFIINKPISDNTIKWYGNKNIAKFYIDYKDTNFDSKNLSLNNIEDIMKYLPSNFEGKIIITADFGKSKIIIFLVFPESISLDEDKLIEEIKIMQSALNSNSFNPIEMNKIGSKFKSYNEICWKAFYDYSLGMNQLNKGDYQLAKDKLERAYSFLCNISDLIYLKRHKTANKNEYTDLLKLIKTVLCILEIKMCYFKTISEISEKSIFYPIKAIKNRYWKNIVWGIKDYLNGIFYDDSTKYFLESCVHILNKEFITANDSIVLFKKKESYNGKGIVSKNAQDLYDFLRGRLEEAKALNEINENIRKEYYEKAKNFYSLIINNSEFSNESSFILEELNEVKH